MKKNILPFLLALCLASTSVAQEFKIIAYSMGRNSPQTIRYDKLTHINYAFAIPQSNGSLAPFNDAEKLNAIVEKAHQNNVKVFISVGGWGIGDGGGNDFRFEKLAAEKESRNRFVNDVSAFLKLYKLDGLDLDWEYPDDSVNRKAGQEKKSSEYFLMLIKELRARLNTENKQLTIAVVGNDEIIGAGVSDQVFNYVDWVNIMSYDNSKEKHHSSYQHAADCLNYWINIRKLPKEKAVLGLPFYGKQPATPYNQILGIDAKAAEKDKVNDIEYNGVKTMRAKTRLAINSGCGGVMFWELSHDVTDKQKSLLQAINDEVKEDK